MAICGSSGALVFSASGLGTHWGVTALSTALPRLTPSTVSPYVQASMILSRQRISTVPLEFGNDSPDVSLPYRRCSLGCSEPESRKRVVPIRRSTSVRSTAFTSNDPISTHSSVSAPTGFESTSVNRRNGGGVTGTTGTPIGTEEEEEDVNENEETEDDEETGDTEAGTPRKPGVPKMAGPSSNPSESVAVVQFETIVPDPHGAMRSIVALVPPLGFAPAKGTPIPSSTSSTIAPEPFFNRRSSCVFGRLMPVVTSDGSIARRDDAAGLLAITSTDPDDATCSGFRRAIVVSTPAFTDTSVQPLKLCGTVLLPLPKAAISTHSSAVDTFDPIHATSVMTTRTGRTSATTTGSSSKSSSSKNDPDDAMTDPDDAAIDPDAVVPEPALNTDPDISDGRRRTEPVCSTGIAITVPDAATGATITAPVSTSTAFSSADTSGIV